MSRIYYFCGVKSQVRYEAAAKSSVFCAPELVNRNKREEWASSNVPKVSALENLTAPIALSLCLKIQVL